MLGQGAVENRGVDSGGNDRTEGFRRSEVMLSR